jgi:hypothetical protein
MKWVGSRSRDAIPGSWSDQSWGCCIPKLPDMCRTGEVDGKLPSNRVPLSRLFPNAKRGRSRTQVERSPLSISLT